MSVLVPEGLMDETRQCSPALRENHDPPRANVFPVPISCF